MPTGIAVFPLTERLRRAVYVERLSIKHLSGWFVAARPYEIKHRFGYHVWDHAEHVRWLQERLHHLRGGLAGASIPPGLVHLVELSQHAPDEYAYVRGAYGVIKRGLLDFYEETLKQCDESANAADVRLLKRLIPEVREQIEWRETIRPDDPNPKRSDEWAAYLQDRLDAIGGLGGDGTLSREEPPLARRFALPEDIQFDERITDEPLMSHDEKLQLDYADALREQFRVFFNEVYAAALLATILYDSFVQDLPWPFVYDVSRHFWDECRHSEFGAVRLRELGYEPDRCNQALFRNGAAMPLLHRFCYLTLVLETHYMPRKKPRFHEYGEAGDHRSQLFADHDWSDEINHVRLGKDWLKRLLESDARDVKQLERETRDLLEKQTGAPVTELSPF